MLKLKYIMIEPQLPIIFHSGLRHDEMAKGEKEVISAGFVHLSGGGADDKVVVICYGKSISLGLESRPTEDSEIIERIINKKI